MPKYWFRQKTFGYGATPSTWQGWALTIVSCLALFGLVLMGPAIRDNTLRALWMILGAVVIIAPTTLIVSRKTEGGWRWRNGNDR
jgi:hypothetical protein